MKKTAIVLSGGGSCGAYQIGVWKALRKLNIDYQIVTGSSVGALNGVMMVQNDFDVAYKMWTHLDYDLIFEKFVDKKNKQLEDKDIYIKYVDEFFKNGGVEISNLEKVVDKLFNEKKFYNSIIDYGIMVYNLSELKAETIVKAKVMKDKIKEYILASVTCFPAFKIKNIGKDKYIDGGYGDNLPINLAIDLGAEKIIAIDLEQVGVKKIIKDKKVDITYIKPRNNIGSFLIFEKEQAKKNIKYGYNDTLKTFGLLKGDKYTFHNYGYCFFINKIHNKFHEYISLLEQDKNADALKNIKNGIVKKILNIDNLNIDEIIQDSINILGEALNIDDTKIHFIFSFNICIKKQFRKIETLDSELIKNKIKNNDISSLLGTKYIVKYIYENLKKGDTTELRLLYTLFKKEFFAVVYLLCIK